MAKKKTMKRRWKTPLFKVYYYENKSARGMQEGRVILTDHRHKDTGESKHFNYFDEIPRAMRKLLKARAQSPALKSRKNPR